MLNNYAEMRLQIKAGAMRSMRANQILNTSTLYGPIYCNKFDSEREILWTM